MAKTLPKRSEVREEVTWDIKSVYPSDTAWEDAMQEAAAAIPQLARFAGHLGESGATLLEALAQRDALLLKVARLGLYSEMQVAGDTTDQAALGRNERTDGLQARAAEAAAPFEPEILALDPTRLD